MRQSLTVLTGNDGRATDEAQELVDDERQEGDESRRFDQSQVGYGQSHLLFEVVLADARWDLLLLGAVGHVKEVFQVNVLPRNNQTSINERMRSFVSFNSRKCGSKTRREVKR